MPEAPDTASDRMLFAGAQPSNILPSSVYELPVLVQRISQETAQYSIFLDYPGKTL